MSRARRDLTGQTFGRLRVVKPAPTRGGHTRWMCLCSCGREHDVATDSLLTGAVRSCGCLHRDVAARRYKEMAARAGAERARMRELYGEGWDRPTGYCNKPTRYVRPRIDAVRDLAAALGIAAPAYRGAPRVHRLMGEPA